MIILAALWLLLAIPTFDSGSIASDDASYDGSGLVLKGHVTLDHGIGTMEAEEAHLQKQVEGQPFPFSFIHLEKGVNLHLNSDAHLICDRADLDFTTLQGALTAATRVVYTDHLKRKNTHTAFQLVGKVVDLQFTKKENTTFDVQTVIAREDVELTYASDYILTTDAILYQKELVDPSQNEFRSHLSSHGSEKCLLTHHADTVEADRFDLDIVHSKLLLTYPQGVKGGAKFTANTLSWEHEKNTVILKGDPKVSDPTLGDISTDLEIHLFETKNHLAGFKSFGNTQIHYHNKHSLESHGTVTFDREKQIGSVESPVIDGSVPDKLQLFYEEVEMGVFADKADIEYTENQNQFQPVSIALKGHIKVISRNNDKFAVADRLTYHPTTRTFILAADPGKKVLFVNDQENIRISAQEVHITHDPTTKQQIVKGIGNVQLALTTEEQLILNKYFPHEPTTP